MKRISMLLLSVTILLGGCGGVMDSVIGLGKGEVIFGSGSLEEGVTDEKSIFSHNDDILLEADFTESAGTTDIQIIVLQNKAGNEYFYDEWYETIEPEWVWMIYEFQKSDVSEGFDSGDYTVKIYNANSVLLAEGFFSINNM